MKAFALVILLTVPYALFPRFLLFMLPSSPITLRLTENVALGQSQVSENMSTKSTPHGSAVWLQCRVNNVSSYGLGHEIWGDFAIENTFQEGTRGRIKHPFIRNEYLP